MSFARFVLCFSLLSGSVAASDIAPSQSQVFEASSIPISEFVAWGAKEINQPIVLGRGVVGTVSFTAPNLQRDDYASFFNNVLAAHGYWIQFENGLYVVKPLESEVTNLEPSLVKLYHLSHVRNTKVAELLQSTLSATNTQLVRDTPVTNFTVEVLPTTNSLLVTASQAQLDKIDLLITGIDRQQRQVFIEAIITETSYDDTHEIGVNMNLALERAGFVVNTSIIDLATDNAAVFEGGDFQALVKAIQTNDNTKLLSKPHILVMDRERGYFTVGQNVPFLVATETSDGGNVTQQIQRQDVGISLEVTPHVVDDQIVLQISQESSSVTNSTIASDIITNKRTLQTVVNVKDGQTIMLGGLISSDERKRISGVPLLKDIPLIGGLFRSERNERVDKELKVVLKTTIL
ncbi:secretin N-terminal domain-containing protein [Vibrio neptunius]|uniref:Type II secretory pathway protein n=1 Tax=Vibrio neptunius TaxID=170651 RepID=A0ABS2ZX97_9VIBR|nr:secretin N-terminal domain-containing protein [Vibrio neptunius]MBN3492256.1 type II secretory pathway protein [Vibrio neptunius]MBN3514929.1 type II secretory pathway protein [Vibrio neptunius]MBN3549636.1 type II secretory pathway protein [Vibrio neptunius]MBN3576881.1 type II secretory pathway protein [Vibrio neptunius]MCH9870545.1 type II secretory pathway protein [Vibrio neptunius]